MRGYGELGDIADGDGGSGIDPGIDARVVDGAADLIEHGNNTLLKRIGGGESGCIERVGGHVDARCTLGTSGVGGVERGDGDTDLRLIAVVLGRGARTFVEYRQLERFRALLVRRQNGLLQCLTGGGAHLVHGGEAHTAAGRRAPPQSSQPQRERSPCGRNVLNQIGRLDRTVLQASTVKPVAEAVSAGLSQQVSVTGKRLAQARHDGRINSSAAQHIALERGAGGVDGTLASNHADAAALGHAAGHATFDDVTGGGIIGSDSG